MRLKVCRKIPHRKIYVRCLGIITDENLNWEFHEYDLTSKLNEANAVLTKLRHFSTSEILRSLYFAIFHSHINYFYIAWGLTRYPKNIVFI